MPSLEAAELIDQRPDERLDTARLEPYLRAHLPGAEGALSVRQFFGGKANLTYLLRFDPPTPPSSKPSPMMGEGLDGGDGAPSPAPIVQAARSPPPHPSPIEGEGVAAGEGA